MSSNTQGATVEPDVVSTAPPLTSHEINAPDTNSKSAQDIATGVTEGQEINNNGAIIVGDLSLDQMWWRKREWVFLREQIEKWLANGEWHDWLWKLKVDPCGGEFCMPTTVEKVISKLPTYVSEHPSYEEAQAWNFWTPIIQKSTDRVVAELEQEHELPFTENDWQAQKAQVLAALADQSPEAPAASDEGRKALEKLLKSIDDVLGLPAAPQAQEQEN